MDWGVCDVKVDEMSWPNVQDESQALVDVTTDMRESNGLNSTRILMSSAFIFNKKYVCLLHLRRDVIGILL